MRWWYNAVIVRGREWRLRFWAWLYDLAQARYEDLLDRDLAKMQTEAMLDTWLGPSLRAQRYTRLPASQARRRE